MLKRNLVVIASAGLALAQRPADVSVCDYYTTALLKDNTAANQLTLLTLLVNTVVIGNYTMPNVGIKVPGILAPGMYNGTEVNLLPYFDGTLASTNRGGSAVAVNFLDGGGAAPLMMNKPANSESSNQHFLLTHLYTFFGALLGCSQYGSGVFSSYAGDPSMFKVHKFMDLNPFQVSYFITQIALAGASFGVAQDDLMSVGMTLSKVFGVRCAPEMTLSPDFGSQLQSICIDGSCPLSPNATCAAYGPVVAPKNVTSGMTAVSPGSLGNGGSDGTTTSSMTPTAGVPTTSPTRSTAPSSTTMGVGSSAGHKEANVVALAAGAFALALWL